MSIISMAKILKRNDCGPTGQETLIFPFRVQKPYSESKEGWVGGLIGFEDKHLRIFAKFL